MSEDNVLPFVVLKKIRTSFKSSEFEVATTEALQILADREANIYVHGGLLVHIVTDGDGVARLATLKRPRIRELLSENIEWRSPTRVEGVTATKRIPAPTVIVDTIMARDSWPELRELTGVADTPVLRPDGTLLLRPGYDQDTGLYYAPKLKLPEIPEAPTLEDARAGLEVLLDIVVDFPFARPADKSACIAAMLTPFVRYAFSGPAPLSLFDANTRGSGKTLLAKAIGMVPLGYEMPCMPPADDDREERKRITAIALRGDRAVLIDNVATKLGTPSLDSALTSTTWHDRILGGNSTFDGELLTCWFATGNNVSLAGDTSRRTLHIRLQAMMENPETRSGFKYPNLLSAVRSKRSELVAAALTLIRGWFVAGQPAQKIKSWGSFEGWASMVPHILVWAGMADPTETRAELVQEGESDLDTLRDLLKALHEYDPKGIGSTARQVAEDLVNDPEGTGTLKEALNERIRTKNGIPSANQIGNLFRAVRQRVVDGYYLENVGRSASGMMWTVRKTV